MRSVLYIKYILVSLVCATFVLSCSAGDVSTAASDRVIIQYADPQATRGSKGLRGLEIVPLDDEDTIEDALAKLQVGSVHFLETLFKNTSYRPQRS